MSDGPRYRFAPSPTGFFHVGGARTALFNWALARRHGGTFVLRIEDTDEARNRPEWTEGIIDALAWLGIAADDPHFEGPLYQSHYADQHLAAAARLHAGGQAYYCDLTGEQIASGASSRDRGLTAEPGRALRFRVPAGTTVVHDEVRGDVEFDNAMIEDFVLVRGNGAPLFNLANVVDDIAMNITHVVRAEEHLPNTPKQQMLWEALAGRTPVWAHVPVLVNEQRKKLSKRRDKVALEQYRSEGYLAAAMTNYLMTLGWSPATVTADASEIAPWSELETAFALADVNKSPAYFDLKKLAAFNGEYIRAMTVDELVAACDPWLPPEWDRHLFARIAPYIQERLVTLGDAPSWVDFLFATDPEIDAEAWAKTMGTEYAAALLADVMAAYEALEAWSHPVLKAALEDVMVRYDLKLGKAQAPVRVAVTGRTVGPPLFESLEILGREETLRRLKAGLDRLA